jgi:hypothetical protein
MVLRDESRRSDAVMDRRRVMRGEWSITAVLDGNGLFRRGAAQIGVMWQDRKVVGQKGIV